MTPGISIRPSEMTEGGAVPVDRNLRWRECRFVVFDYTTREGVVTATTTAGRINYVDDDGQEYVQHYSAADPARFQPSSDGKTLVAVGDAQALSKSSNFAILMNSLVNAGFPENKLSDDISALDGLYTHNIGIPEPKRSGLQRVTAEGEQQRERVISVPDVILELPGESKGKGKAPAKTAKAEEADEDAGAAVLAIVAELVEAAGGGKVTRQAVATKAIRDGNDDVAQVVFSPEFAGVLSGGGYSLTGEDITAG